MLEKKHSNIIRDGVGFVFRLTCGGSRKITKIKNWLYYKDCLCLERKYIGFKKILPKTFKGYTWHKGKQRFRVNLKGYDEKYFKTVEECKLYLKELKHEYVAL